MGAYTSSYVYTQTHSIIFMGDSLRNTLRDVIRECGLSPEKLMQDWGVIERGIRTWLESGHLRNIIIEFFKPWESRASARWDFPIGYSGSGVDDDMWIDKAYLRQLIAKSVRPTADCGYRIVLTVADYAPKVDGFAPCSLLSTGNLSARQSGTVIATSHLTANVTYWR